MTVHYVDYLQLNKILSAQSLRSEAFGVSLHDEHFFILTHQVCELWFKQILVELGSVCEMMCDHHVMAEDLWKVVNRLRRVVGIIDLLIEQIKLIETLSPKAFFEIRPFLQTASGFQSYQFRLIEVYLGALIQDVNLYQLQPEHVILIQQAQKKPTLLFCLEQWLAQLPMDQHDTVWQAYECDEGLAFTEREAINLFKNRKLSLSYEGMIKLLFLHAYKDCYFMELPYALIGVLLRIDQGLMDWRKAHAHMAFRMIQHSPGTGGSTGYPYLKSTAEKSSPFQDIGHAMNELVLKKSLPPLSKNLIEQYRCYEWEEKI